jgi:3-hydroxyisobutyrate dehydrogenase-like beta-hydroxyacid dehydrogenase
MNNTATKPRIGFIGLGAMGSRMAARIAAAGYPLTVYNRSPEPARAFADRGAAVAGSPRELAGKVDVVISSVFDDDSVAAILEGPDGVLAAARPGLTVIEMSTLSPAASERFHAAAKKAKIDYLDSPVSGSTVPAEKGELVILVGGEAGVFERVKPILLTMGKAAELIGPGGAASKAKLCINALVAVGVQALAESLAMGEAGGLDRAKLLDVIGQTAAVSPAQKSKFDNARSGKYPPAFALKAVAKDLRLMADWAGSNGVKVPTIAATKAAADSAVPNRGAEDLSVLIDTARP